MQINYVSENDTLFLVFSAEEPSSSGEMSHEIIADFAADGSIVSIWIKNFERRKDHLELKLRLQRLDQIKPLVAESRVSSERIIIEGILIDNALKRAMRKAAIMHKKMGNTVVSAKISGCGA